MNRQLARAVVAQLRLSGDAGDIQQLSKFTVRDWRRTYQWLDDSGLALYLLRYVESLGAAEMLPPEVRARLESSFNENRIRCEYIAESFATVNQLFQQAGVPFAVIKGPSLVPEYCPDALLRSSSDLDYLMEKRSLSIAARVLETAGYRLQKSSEIELKFFKPSARMPQISDSPYSINTEPLIELHTGFWNRANNIPLEEPLFSLENAVCHNWRELRFQVLNPRDAFLLQVIHIFQHTVECWVKLNWLLEIGTFLLRRLSDSDLWHQVDDRINEVPCLRDFAAVVIELARIVFSAPVPTLAQNWVYSLLPGSRLWLDNYAEIFAFDDHPLSGDRFFPTGKLSLLLHQQYISDPEIRGQMIRRRLVPWKRPERIAYPGDRQSETVTAVSQLQLRWMLTRIIFHFGSDVRYLWELPRWRQLTN